MKSMILVPGVLTNESFGIIIRYCFNEDNLMDPKYEIGQKVVISLANDQSLTPRDCAAEPYAGQIGEVADYYWINPRGNQRFYIYTVRVGAGHKEVVLHEDELESCID